MRTLRRIQTSSCPSSSSSTPSSLSRAAWFHLRSLHRVASWLSSSPVHFRGSLKSAGARRKQKHAVLTRHQWSNFFTAEGKLRDGGMKCLKKVRGGGIEPSIRAEVWPYLLGLFDLKSSITDRNNIRRHKRKEYDQLRRRCRRIIKLGNHCNKEVAQPNRTVEDFTIWQRIIRLDAIRANADWLSYSLTQAAVTLEMARKHAISVGLNDYDHLEPRRIYHAARLVSILEAYALYDPEIGYCQGMSDLLSPILAVMEQDYEAFWCFVGFMKKARHNFRLDEVGIRRQLSIVSKIIKSKDSHLYRHLEKLQAEDCFFAYRMVVVVFRRELTFEQTLCLWEVIWADQAAIRAGIGKSARGRIRMRVPPTDDLLLYAIAASVLQRRKLIIENYSSMDEILGECNSMAGQLDVRKLLDDAHDLVVALHDKIE